MIFHRANFVLNQPGFSWNGIIVFHLSAPEGRHVATKVDVEWRLSGIDLE